MKEIKSLYFRLLYKKTDRPEEQYHYARYNFKIVRKNKRAADSVTNEAEDVTNNSRRVYLKT